MAKIIRKNNYLLKSTAIESYMDYVERAQYRPEVTTEWDIYPSYYVVYKFTKIDQPLVIHSEGRVFKLFEDQILIVPPKKLIKWVYPSGYMEWKSYCILDNYEQILPKQCTILSGDTHFHFETYSELIDTIRKLSNVKNSDISPKACYVSEKLSQFLNHNFYYDISLMEMYDDLKIPASSANFYFKKTHGLSPAQYRNTMRIFESLKHITHGQKIINIAKSLGYNDYSCFYKQFVSILGVSPADFDFNHDPRRF